MGHPGPRSLNKYVASYIVTKKVPDFAMVTKEDVGREDVRKAIQEVNNM